MLIQLVNDHNHFYYKNNMLILRMPVRKIISFFLVVLMGASTFSLGELLKVPELISHYKVHKVKNDQIDFHRFLFLHYSIETGTDDDADNDRQLPFNSAEAYISAHAPVIKFNEEICVSNIVVFINNTSYFLSNDRFIPNTFNSDVWQPPRV